jgi:hypothetical protein
VPTLEDNSKLVNLYQHDGMMKGQPFTLSNIVLFRVRNGIVWAIAASKSTTS